MKFQIHGADLTNARNLRKAATPAERLVWSMLRAERFRGLKFRQQHRLGPFIVDFYCASLSLAIELDGKDHFSELGRMSDEGRKRMLREHGIQLIRFENAPVLANPKIVLDAISEILCSALGPSP